MSISYDPNFPHTSISITLKGSDNSEISFDIFAAKNLDKIKMTGLQHLIDQDWCVDDD